MSKRVILVGHCNVDGPRLQSEIASCVQGAEVLRINSDNDLRRTCEEGGDLWLINREPVGFGRSAGVDLVRQVCGGHPGAKVMLVSDYPEAQADAVAAGAMPGFGKRDIGSPKLAETVRNALNGDNPSDNPSGGNGQ
jgi:hypothetical protein